MTLVRQYSMDTQRTPGIMESTATILSSLTPYFSMPLAKSVVVHIIWHFLSIPSSTPVMRHANPARDKCFTWLCIFDGNVIHILLSMVLLTSSFWWGKFLNAMMSLASSIELGGFSRRFTHGRTRRYSMTTAGLETLQPSILEQLLLDECFFGSIFHDML